MKTRTILFFVISMFVLIPNILADKIEINLLDRVTLNEKTVTFSDVATVSGDDVDLVNKINRIEIGSTPLPNNVRKDKCRFHENAFEVFKRKNFRRGF